MLSVPEAGMMGATDESIGAVIRGLFLIYQVFEVEDMIGKLEYL